MKSKSYFKIQLLLLLTIGILASCSSIGMQTSSANNDWKRYYLHGEIKTYLEKYYKVEKKFGEWEKGEMDINYHNRVSFDSHGKNQWTEQLYEDKGLLVLTGKIVPTRENGVEIGIEQYDKDGKLSFKTNIIHHSKDEIESIMFDKDGKKLFQGRSYYSKHKFIKQTITSFLNNKVEEITIVQAYDKDGNMISQKETDQNGKIIHFRKYEYLAFDKQKNWTKRLNYDTIVGEEPVHLVIREYEYY